MGFKLDLHVRWGAWGVPGWTVESPDGQCFRGKKLVTVLRRAAQHQADLGLPQGRAWQVGALRRLVRKELGI